jgi:hypothetical protein
MPDRGSLWGGIHPAAGFSPPFPPLARRPISIFQSKNDPEIGERFQHRMILKIGTPGASGFPF